MRFINTIVEKRNLVVEKLNACKKNGYKTYIIGNGEGASNIENRFSNFVFDGRLVNRDYLQFTNSRCPCLEEVLDETKEKINLIIGCRGFREEKLELWKSKIEIIVNLDCFSGNYWVDSELMTYSFVNDNKDKIQKVFEMVEDDYSRHVLSAYINQKISMDYKYLRGMKTENQYFEKDIIQLTEDEVFVDCGAYIGDTALGFIKALKNRGIKSYNKIISFEPNPFNFEKLSNIGLINHICINKCTSDSQGKLNFSIAGTSSGIKPSGEIIVEMDKLDNMIIDKVSFLKMDVEGAELASLKGAEKLIKKNRPKLAICVYHKKEDLWEIIDFIEKLNLKYIFYLRVYEETATELVLYAIPK